MIWVFVAYVILGVLFLLAIGRAAAVGDETLMAKNMRAQGIIAGAQNARDQLTSPLSSLVQDV